ncbi:hypothetical protein [uncultured Hymenobacter sp.]|uniref:hypothetical protein n=1 Tax=uncultured Hymenobacter sp. TaxID=170016 RepID=UPI0035CBC7FB
MPAAITHDHLNATLHALQNGVTGIPISAAMDNTEVWQQQLWQSGDVDLQHVAREFGNLQSLLTSERLDGAAIASSLSMLGDQTSQASAKAPAELKADLIKLADALRRAGGDMAAAVSAKAAKKK